MEYDKQDFQNWMSVATPTSAELATWHSDYVLAFMGWIVLPVGDYVAQREYYDNESGPVGDGEREEAANDRWASERYHD